MTSFYQTEGKKKQYKFPLKHKKHPFTSVCKFENSYENIPCKVVPLNNISRKIILK